MRIVIDMQGAQSAGSENRGIGRYTLSLVKAMIVNRGAHDIYLVLNATFPKSIERIRTNLEGLLPQSNIRVWTAPVSISHEPSNKWLSEASEIIYEAFLESLSPDFVLVCSLFEGHADNIVTSVKRFSKKYFTAVILYDLIPYIYRNHYLENPTLKEWYLNRIEHFRRADLWMAISEHSRQDGIQQLGLSPAHCINISTDADKQFKRIEFSVDQEMLLRNQYGLKKSFLMYTGGIDHRKNVDGLIRAYAKLTKKIRENHQLAIVCSIHDQEKLRLIKLAANLGLKQDQLVFTGRVTDEILIGLYNLCKVFIFPSWYEGFGLPVLEAMRCGAAVIGANTSSLPEVINLEEALFDPHSEESIQQTIERALGDEMFRDRLINNAKNQSHKFSWDKTAMSALSAMSRHFESATACVPNNGAIQKRLKIAYISPLPPERSGISDYSAELLPSLGKYYDVDVVVAQDKISDVWVQENCSVRTVDWFKKNSQQFDRILYHFGNSSFHQHMFELLRIIPGVVVLHDFYLSGILYHMQAIGFESKCFDHALFQSHGKAGLLERKQAKDVADVIWKYPCSREVIERSIGTIVHSKNSIKLAKQWYSVEPTDLALIPLLRASPSEDDLLSARVKLGISSDIFLACSFGIISPTKLNKELLNAWLNSRPASSGKAILVFIGENDSGEYGREISSLIKKHPNGNSVQIAGWVDKKVFRSYLAAADLGVQLRTLSRGETSAAALDCMNYGLATIVNSNGSMSDLPDDVVWKLQDVFDLQELTEAIETLWSNNTQRKILGLRAKNFVQQVHDPVTCAQQYYQSIEKFYAISEGSVKKIITSISLIDGKPKSDHDLQSIAFSISEIYYGSNMNDIEVLP
jgi:glycosyltransferase involved in cell wall biosynthesis